MILNAVEKRMMNNPVRSLIQRHFEARRLRAMGGRMDGGRALEVGCGQGVGAGLVLDVFGADRVDAFDLDMDMVARAHGRLRGRADRAAVWQGSATEIPAPPGSYDAVFDFGIIHHIPDWPRALEEVCRVLRPGGRFYAEEILARFIHAPVWRSILDHPMENRFDHAGFCRGVEEAGLRLTASRHLFDQVGWYVAEKPA